MHASLLPYHPERDVYRLLELDPGASSEEISAACRRLARTFHPDRNRSPRANEEMGVVNAVRDMLTNPVERAAYDRARSRFLTGWTPGVSTARQAVSEHMAPEQPGWRRRLPAVVERTLRALVAAFRAALGVLGPTYCPTCGSIAEAEYLFCGDCGTRLRRVRRLSVG